MSLSATISSSMPAFGPVSRSTGRTGRIFLWIREPFLNSGADFGKFVVHGHTPVPEPDERINRFNIDTGAYLTNRLTCLVLEGRGRRILQTTG